MTKEEILNKYAKDELYNDGLVFDGPSDSIFDAMQEYAAQEAVAFAEFTVTWDIHISQNRDFQWKSKLPSIYGERSRTTAELYAEFVKDQTPKSL